MSRMRAPALGLVAAIFLRAGRTRNRRSTTACSTALLCAAWRERQSHGTECTARFRRQKWHSSKTTGQKSCKPLSLQKGLEHARRALLDLVKIRSRLGPRPLLGVAEPAWTRSGTLPTSDIPAVNCGRLPEKTLLGGRAQHPAGRPAVRRDAASGPQTSAPPGKLAGAPANSAQPRVHLQEKRVSPLQPGRHGMADTQQAIPIPFSCGARKG